MRRGTLALVTALMAMGAVVACDDDPPTMPTTTFVAQLSAANEKNNDGTPKNTNSTATGLATFKVTGNLVEYVVTANGLTGPATLSHIHVGSATQNGGVIWGFTINTVASGTITSGLIDLTQPPFIPSVSADSMMKLWNSGNAYVNVHTNDGVGAVNTGPGDFPGGEIRGQLGP